MELQDRNKRINKKGFTIVELILASVVALIILGIGALIYLSSQKSFKMGTKALSTQASLRLAMDWLTRDIREAKNLTVSGDTVTLIIPSQSGDITVQYSQENYSNKDYLKRIEDATSRYIAPVSIITPIPVTTNHTVTIVLHSTEDPTQILTSEVTMRNAD